VTYFGFLALFLGLPLLLLVWLTWRDQRRGLGLPPAWHAPAAWAVLAVHIAVAVIYTTPWDNYLVATRVWYYDPARVTGVTLGWVPIEEYTFFVLQTLLTGTWLLWLGRHLTPAPQPVRRSPRLRWGAVVVGLLFWAPALAILILGWRPGTYLALILAWMLPPVLLQLGVGADALWHHRRWVALALFPALVYLAIADSLAISAGVWTISSDQSTGILLGGVLPIEEFIFFAITNALIVFGMSLMLATGHELYQSLVRRRAQAGPASANGRPSENSERVQMGS